MQAEINGRSVTLKAPAGVQGSAVYVPAGDLSLLFGWYIHCYGKNSGEFILISNYPVTPGDLSGEKNQDYSIDAPDDTLAAFKNLGDDFLGPSLSDYSAHTLMLMCGSIHAVIAESGAATVTPIKARGGKIFVPIKYCARCFNAQVGTTPEGDPSLKTGDETSAFLPLYAIRLKRLRLPGYKFLTVSDLAFMKGRTLAPGQVCDCFP